MTDREKRLHEISKKYWKDELSKEDMEIFEAGHNDGEERGIWVVEKAIEKLDDYKLFG